MAIVYADYVLGNDTSGDGSAGNPYKTFNKATDGLTGGDEVRFALTAQLTLSGTLTFTNGSTTVNTSADLRSEVSVHDIIRHPADNEAWWRVSAIGASTITLFRAYWGTDGSGKTGYRLRPTNLTTVQNFLSEGTSEASRLKVSGGWDLATETKTGLTALGVNNVNSVFYNTSYASQYAYIEMSDFCIQKLDFGDAHGCYFHDMYGFDYYLTIGSRAIMEDTWFGGSELFIDSMQPNTTVPIADRGKGRCVLRDIFIYSGSGIEVYGGLNFFERVHVYNGSYCAIFAQGCSNSFFKDCIFDTMQNATPEDCGYFYSDWNNYNNIFANCTFRNSNTYAAIEWDSYSSNTATFIDCTFENLRAGIVQPSGFPDDEYRLGRKPIFTIHNTTGDSYRVFKDGGKITSTETGSITGKCLKFTPTIHFFDLEEPVGAFEITSAAADIDLSIYMKKDGSFVGEVWLMVVRNGCHLGLTPVTLTTEYVAQTVTIGTADLVVGEYLTMWVIVQGSAGNVFADNFTAV